SNWFTILAVQVFIWFIILLERKHLKKAPLVDRIIFISILILSAFLSFMNVENLPGPTTVLRFIFGPWQNSWIKTALHFDGGLLCIFYLFVLTFSSNSAFTPSGTS